MNVKNVVFALFPRADARSNRLREAIGAILIAQGQTEAWSEMLGQVIAMTAELTDPDGHWPDPEQLEILVLFLEDTTRAFARARDATESAGFEIESIRMEILTDQKLEAQRKAEQDVVSDRAGDQRGVV